MLAISTEELGAHSSAINFSIDYVSIVILLIGWFCRQHASTNDLYITGLSNTWPAGHIVALRVVWNGPRLRLKLLPNNMGIRILIYFSCKQEEKFTFFIICII